MQKLTKQGGKEKMKRQNASTLRRALAVLLCVALALGMTLPVFRWYNGLSIGLELGRRGLATSQVKENYFGFNVGFNIFDIWFQKRAYQ